MHSKQYPPTPAELADMGYSNKEIQNILSVKGDPTYIWAALKDCPAGTGDPYMADIDIFGSSHV